MRLIATATRTKALQNSLVGRHSVGRGLGWSSEESGHCNGPGKGGSTRAWGEAGGGGGVGISKLSSECWLCALCL